ncbi:MAG TPA: hypothetical protein DCF68_21690 [Cyanothece sp. UBA12306]|nr:hypothetical protein [Cyanothece sp. UBA12306]
MLNKSTNFFTLLRHYLLYLFLVGVVTLGLSYAINDNREVDSKVNLEKTGSLILKRFENSP